MFVSNGDYVLSMWYSAYKKYKNKNKFTTFKSPIYKVFLSNTLIITIFYIYLMNFNFKITNINK